MNQWWDYGFEGLKLKDFYKEKQMAMTEKDIQECYDLFKEPYGPGIRLVEEVRRLKAELQQHKTGWDGSNSQLAKAYDEIAMLKRQLQEAKQPKGLPLTYTVAQASLLIQQLAKGIQFKESNSPHRDFTFNWLLGATSTFTNTNPPSPIPTYVTVTVTG